MYLIIVSAQKETEREREKAIQSNSHKVQVLPQEFFIPFVNVSNTPKALNGSLQSTQGQSKQGPTDLDEEIITDFSGALGLVPGKNQIGLSEAKKMGRAPEFPGDWHHSCWSMLILVIDVLCIWKYKTQAMYLVISSNCRTELQAEWKLLSVISKAGATAHIEQTISTSIAPRCLIHDETCKRMKQQSEITYSFSTRIWWCDFMEELPVTAAFPQNIHPPARSSNVHPAGPRPFWEANQEDLSTFCLELHIFNVTSIWR